MKKKINVVLKEKVEHLGDIGETKSVALGFFKNFLLPQGLVVPVGAKEAKELVERKQRETVEVSETQEAAAKYRKKSVKVIKRKKK